jgi:hypothetical protein
MNCGQTSREEGLAPSGGVGAFAGSHSGATTAGGLDSGSGATRPIGGQTQPQEGGEGGQSEVPIGGLAGQSSGGGDSASGAGAGGDSASGAGAGGEAGQYGQGGRATSEGGASTSCSELPVTPPGAAGAGLCSATYQFVRGSPGCFLLCRDWEEQLDCEEGCLCDSGCDGAPEHTYATYTCRALEPLLEFWIGNPPPGNASCDTVSCPGGYAVKHCEDWCAENPNCEASGETWYAHLTCEICSP